MRSGEPRAAGTLDRALAAGGEALSPRGRDRLHQLFRLLRAWRGRGITGFATEAALASGYFAEALALRVHLPPSGPRLDIGSGGGTPALPLAVAEDDAGRGGAWTLLEPRRQAAAFLGAAVEALGLEDRVRTVRKRLGDYLEAADGQRTVRAASAVTLRGVRLRCREWEGLAAGLPAGARVVWPTSAAARARADLRAGLFCEQTRPATRGIVWIGEARRR